MFPARAAIAAEARRLIHEACSAFVQGLMPALPRPEVDAPEGLAAAMIVDRQGTGADPGSAVGTATDAHAMLRNLFSRLGQPYIGPPAYAVKPLRLGWFVTPPFRS